MEQISLIKSAEEAAYERIRPALEAILKENRLPADTVALRKRGGSDQQEYFSVAFELKSDLVQDAALDEDSGSAPLVLKYGGKKNKYLAVRKTVMTRFSEIAVKEKPSYGKFCHIEITSFDEIANYTDVIQSALREVIDRIPKGFDCCSRYLECSNTMKCTNPDGELSFLCGYRRILRDGKVFYGDNRNVM